MADSISVDKWLDFWKYYEGLSNQELAVRELFEDIPTSLKLEGSAWITQYREPEPEPEVPDLSNPLAVPYFWQQDNGPEGWRQCQTSSIAMCLAYLSVPGIEDDTDYLHVVNKFGDTTVQETHRQALASIGVKAEFRQDLHKDDLIAEIDRGYPVAVGMLHHGSLSNPTGGHYIVIRGYSSSHALVHDSYGEQNLVTGSWDATGKLDGKDQAYSWENFLQRWDVGGGWGWIFDPVKK
tara:strand:+ start:49 stop:759 length:711 start_codon:yes stop_codon:yes gene_type:complete